MTWICNRCHNAKFIDALPDAVSKCELCGDLAPTLLRCDVPVEARFGDEPKKRVAFESRLCGHCEGPISCEDIRLVVCPEAQRVYHDKCFEIHRKTWQIHRLCSGHQAWPIRLALAMWMLISLCLTAVFIELPRFAWSNAVVRPVRMVGAVIAATYNSTVFRQLAVTVVILGIITMIVWSGYRNMCDRCAIPWVIGKVEEIRPTEIVLKGGGAVIRVGQWGRELPTIGGTVWICERNKLHYGEPPPGADDK